MGSGTGTPGDFAARLRAALPRGWFADQAPVLDAVLAGFADGWARLYALLAHVRRQGRIGSAEGGMLDLIAGDFFGAALQRRAGQGDEAFRRAIGRELLRERATRGALAAALTDLTGRAPVIFEPSRPADTGAWGVALGYGAAGGYGSLTLPFQCFVTAFRPQGAGIAGVAGYEGLRADGLLDSRTVSSRATDGTYLDAAGVLRVAAPGVARMDFSGGAPALLVEGGSANLIRNPRAEGAAAPATLPSWWGSYATQGLAWSVAGTGTEAGIPFIDLRLSGTASASAMAVVSFEPTTRIAAASGDIWTASAFVRLIGGAVGSPNFALRIEIDELNAAGGFVAGGAAMLSPTSAPLATQRASYGRTLSGGAATAFVQPLIRVGYPAGATVDVTLRIGAPQMERGAAASSVMLPPAGSPGVSTRAGESVGIPATLAGGYGAGAALYASPAMVLGQVSDADIHDAAARTMPAAAIAWTRISS